MFVRGVAMEKLVLDETSELSKLRNVTAEKVDPVHHPKHASHIALARNDGFEYLPRFLCVAKRARYNAQIASEEIGEVGAQVHMALLRQLKGPHHCFRIFHEIRSALWKELPVANAKIIDFFLRGFQTR